MSVSVEVGKAIPFEEFWGWIKHHANCILRVGSGDAFLYDHESLHWALEEDPDGNPNVLQILGKVVVGEMVLDVHDALFVQAAPDKESEEPGQFIFEIIGGPREEPYPLYHFLLTHGFEGEQGSSHAAMLKH